MTNKPIEIGWRLKELENNPLPDNNELAVAVVGQSKPNHIIMKKSRRRSSSSTDDSDSSSSSSSQHSAAANSNSDDDKQNRKDVKKEKRREEKKLKKETKRLEKNERKKLKKAKKEMYKEEKRIRKLQKKSAKKSKRGEKEDDCSIPIDLMFTKAQAPETPEEYKARQSQIRREIDPVTGRSRLIKGDGEILEEIVSRERHLAINKEATRGDGQFFQLNTVTLNFK